MVPFATILRTKVHSYTMRTVLLTALMIAAGLTTVAQYEVRITHPEVLRTSNDVLKGKAAKAGLQAAGLPEDQQQQVLLNSSTDVWPTGLANDSARKANAPYIKNYSAFRLFSYTEEEVPLTVVMLPAKDNIHMPEELRPAADLFVVLPDSALTAVEAPKTRPEISRGPRWKNRDMALILRPDELYATYDLGNDETARKALEASGMSQPEIDAVVFRSHERNWPDGIDSFDERAPLLNNFKKYKTYVGADWDDKVLVIVPVDKNKSMPKLMRPYVDVYFVYAKTALQVKAQKKKKGK